MIGISMSEGESGGGSKIKIGEHVEREFFGLTFNMDTCLLYTSPSPRDS